jgi:Fe-Mn family superoxide dismutase
MCEHAYYLQYKNVKADYIKAFWNVVNWSDVQTRFNAASTQVSWSPLTDRSARWIRSGDGG